jgi:hypothetical protein
MGAQDSPDEVEHDWLGAPMFFSHYGAKRNRALRSRRGFRSRGSGCRGRARGPGTPPSSSGSWRADRSVTSMTDVPGGHPGPTTAALPGAIRGDRDPARAEYPNEAVGLVIGDRPAGDGGQALGYEPARNRGPRPIATSSIPRTCCADHRTDDAGEVFWRSSTPQPLPAVPSPTDIGLAFQTRTPSTAGLARTRTRRRDTGEPGLRGWRIVDGTSMRSPSPGDTDPWSAVAVGLGASPSRRDGRRDPTARYLRHTLRPLRIHDRPRAAQVGGSSGPVLAVIS